MSVSALDGKHHVFALSALALVPFIAGALLFPDGARIALSTGKLWVVTHLDWLFMVTANLVLLFCGFIALSPLGKIRLGGPDAKPDFSALSWAAMLFSAGVGTGMVFYGTAEPAAYFTGWSGTPLNVDPYTPQAERLAFSATLLHWGLTPWALYAVIGLALAFFHYNKGLPLTIRSAFFPLFGARIWGWPGHLIDSVAVIATIFGLATALGMGVTLVGSGLNSVFGIQNSLTLQITLIAGITGLAIWSVVRGLSGGIRLLSNLNMGLAGCLLAFIILAGPTAAIIKSYLPNTLSYVRDFIALSDWRGRSDTQWYHGWTILYWAWWIAWSPFVGLFIARISRGRSVRAFLGFTIILPTCVGILWFSSFGAAAVSQIKAGVGDLANGITADHMVLYQTLETLPFADITSLLAICLLIIFFVTSSDSGSLVVDTITAGGKLDSPLWHRVFWASIEGFTAIALLVGGGTTAISTLQNGVILAGLPFTIVVFTCCFSLLKALRDERAGLAS